LEEASQQTRGLGRIVGSEVCEVGEGVTVGKNSSLVGRRVIVGAGTRIGDDVKVRADEVVIGNRCVIEDRVIVSWRGGGSKLFRMGDCSTISSDSRVLVRVFEAGDYVVLHNHLLVNGDASCSLGNNCWMGQNGILNANQPVKIGNGVGIGAYSAVWTHGKFGALLDGCLIHKEAPVVIEDNACVWHAVISPGVTVGRKAIVLNGSVVTGDVGAESCYGGVPAVDLSKKVRTYRDVSPDEKFRMMKEFAGEFLEKEFAGEYEAAGEDEYLVKGGAGGFRLLLRRELGEAVRGPAIVVTLDDHSRTRTEGVSVFEISSMEYTKWLSEPEVRFMWFLLDSRARFNPAGQ
jgi:acetyltransferase-like isoleucine patch superfamily enzyme